MISEQLVDLSRLQFAATAMYHFLFVHSRKRPGVGFAVLLAILNAMWGENEEARALARRTDTR